MKDHVPGTGGVLGNGALKYGIYDSNGTLLRYEYIKLEDSPTEAGTSLTKANLLTDIVAALFGLTDTATINDVLNAIANKVTAIDHGGTGGSTAAAGLYNLINALGAVTPVSADKFPFLDDSGSTAGYVTLANLVTALRGAGAAQIAAGGYTGNGSVGNRTISLDFTPTFVIIVGYNCCLWVKGSNFDYAFCISGSSSAGTSKSYYTTTNGFIVDTSDFAISGYNSNVNAGSYYYIAGK